MKGFCCMLPEKRDRHRSLYCPDSRKTCSVSLKVAANALVNSCLPESRKGFMSVFSPLAVGGQRYTGRVRPSHDMLRRR